MSKMFDMDRASGVVMSFEEKQTWVYLATAIVFPSLYFRWLFGAIADVPAADVSYAGPMLTSAAAAVIVTIAATIITALTRPSEAGTADERDRAVNRLGETAGSYVLASATLLGLGLAILEIEHLWIGNALYAGLIAQAITVATVKLVAYRRGV